MAATLAVRSHCEVSRDNGHLGRKMPQRKTGLDDTMNVGCYSLAMRRCASSCVERDLALEKTTPLSSEVQCLGHLETIKAILDNLDTVAPDSAGSTESPHFDPPPSYKDSIADQPPNYDCIDDPVLAQVARHYPIPPPAYSYRSPKNIVPLFQMTAPNIDFGNTSNVRQVANKKKDKQQKKQADAAKWKDEGGEGNAEGGDENDGGGAGGGAGGGNYGDGGAGDDGGGGDDWNSWDTGKKGKKGKKAKEEEKKRQEEEEEQEKKRKEEEEANGVGHVDWADDMDGDVGDDWAAFSTTTTKKGKKDKKGKVSKDRVTNVHAAAHVPKIEPTTNGTSEFADISLNDNAPKIDLSFDQPETKGSGGFGSFGGWGGGGPWNTGSNWNFSGAESATADIADSFARATQDSAADTTDSNTWSFGGNKKNQKKKTTSSGFDSFNFGAVNEEVEDEKGAEDKVDGNEHWGTSAAAGKKEKKTKKKATFGDISNDPDPNTIGTALADPEPAAGDPWNTWGDNSAKKKKGKKGEEEVLAPSQTAAVVNLSTEPALDEWGVFDTKKAGKKGKKIIDVDEPPVVAASEPEPEPWAAFGKKEKKKGKKELEKVEDLAATTAPEAGLEFDTSKGSFGKKDKRKGGKKESEMTDEPTSALPPDPDPGLDFGFGSLGKKDDKKGKKGKKEFDEVEEPTETAFQEPEAAFDMEFGSWGKADDKKIKKAKKEPKKAEESTITTFPKKGNKDDMSEEAAFNVAPEQEAEADIGWGTFTKKEVKKKGKKDADKTEELPTKEPDQEPVDDWASFGKKDNKDKKKAKKTNLFGEPEKEVDKIIEETHEPEVDTAWGGFSLAKEKKKNKKDAMEETKPIEPEPLVDDKPSLTRTGSTKGRKGKKGLVTEVEEDTMPTIGSNFALDATSVAADVDWATSFTTDKKKDKKNKRNSLASTGSKGDEPPPPPPPVPDVPDTSSFDIWNSTKKDKDKKGKKGKVVEPELVAAPEAEEKKDSVQDDLASWAGLTAKEKRKKEKEKKDRELKEAREKEEAEEKERKEQEEAEERERKEKEEVEAKEKEENEKKGKAKLGKKGKTPTSPEAFKTKNLLAGSIPDAAAVAEEDKWGPSWGAAPFKKDTKKGARKDMLWETPPPAPTPPAQGLTPEPEEDVEEDDQDDNWGDYAPAKTTTKGKKDVRKDGKEDLKAGKKGMKEKMEDVIDETSKKSAKDEMKKKDVSKEDTPAKAAKNFWGNVATTPASKSKMNGKDKEKAAREAKEKEEKAEEYDDYDDEDEEDEDMLNMLNEEPPMAKLWKTNTKDSDKASKASKGSNSAEKGKGKGGKFKEKEIEIEEVDDEPKVKGKGNNNSNSNTVAFSPWPSTSPPISKKTTVNKTDISVSGKKEIGAKNLTNQKTTGSKEVSNDPEPTNIEDDHPSTSQPYKSSKLAMSASKSSTKTSSVLQRVKEIEKEKEKTKASPFAPPVDVDPEPSSKFDIKAGASGKSKDLASSKTTPAKTKDFSPTSKTKKKTSKEEAVPGSFPGEAMDDDFNNLDELLNDDPPLEKKESKKSAKSVKDSKFTSKTSELPESNQPPTPPPEIKEEKPVKKERPRIAKEGGASSWGLWGAAPPKKKDIKSKDDADILSPPKKEKVSAPGFTRSKSTRTAKEKDKATVKSDSKSSDSDKPKKTESRPPKSRGSSFGAALFGPPIRTKSVRKNSTAASATKSAPSRRQSVDVGATGLPSPPAEEAPNMASKAAKMMGTAKLDRKASTRGKQKMPGKKAPVMLDMPSDTADSGNAVVPDPYAIDSDDMVMVNDIDGGLLDGKTTSTAKDLGSKKKSKGMDAEPGSSLRKDLPDRSKFKSDSKVDPGGSKKKSKIGNDFEDDVVMVDAGSSGDAGVEPGPDDMQFITKPKGFQRSATNSKKIDSKSGGSGGGLFGAFRKNRRATEVNELPKSRGIVEDEEIAPRKRTVSGGDDSAKRPRRDDRRKSDKADRAAEGYVYDTARDVGGVTEAEAVDARREKRRAKRAEDDRNAKEQREEALKYETDRRAKRREADKAKLKDDRDRARKDDEAEARRLEDKEDRRAAREARRRDEEANRALEDDILKPRSKRRDTEKEAPAASSSRPRTSDRRRSHIDKATERPKSSRRKSTMAPVDDYFDPRNGRPVNENDPYGGNDHTASWVKSQVSEPPEPPPVEPTIMEQAPDFRTKGADDLMEDEYARRASHKKPKRSSRMYTDPLGDGQEERRRRRKEKEVRSSEGSAAEERYGGLGSMNRRPSDLGGVKLGAGTKTFDGKTGQGKRSSWFQKVTGF